MKGVRNGVSIFASTGYCVGTIAAMLLNAILPEDAGVDMSSSPKDETQKTAVATGKADSSEEDPAEAEVDA
jgi:NCS2 family nucleobase:cation symporter-2